MKISYKEKIILTPEEMRLLNSANELLDTIYGSVKSDELENICCKAVYAIADVLMECEQEEK